MAIKQEISSSRRTLFEKFLWTALLVLNWLYTQFVAWPTQWWLDNVLTSMEESTKASIRETFAFFGRVINGVASVFVSAFIDRGFYQNKKQSPRRKRRTEAWSNFWDSSGGTLNAIIEQEGIIEKRHSSKGPTFNGSRSAVIRRSGSDLFDRPSGFGVAQTRMERRGLSESVKIWLELGVEIFFSAWRGIIHMVIIGRDASSSKGEPRHSSIAGQWEDLNVWTSSDIIIESGYPLEEHVVTTKDGYILSMQRIPRKDSKEVVFFQHGVLDTSLGWVCNGPEGSQAFAAYDAGADVWLGNCRANPPRAHVDPNKSGASYWAYSINELGLEDVTALIRRIDAVKRSELSIRGSGLPGGSPCVYYKHGRSSSNPELDFLDRSISKFYDEETDDTDFKLFEKEEITTYGNTQSLNRPAFECGIPRQDAEEKQQKMTPDRVSFKGRERTHSEWNLRMKEELTKSGQIPALHIGSSELKGSIFGRTAPLDSKKAQPYRLRVVAHSLGAASVLIYAVMCRVRGQPHRITKMVLLTPAGFHRKRPNFAIPFLYMLPIVMRLLNSFRPGVGAPAYIPSSLLRYITFKLSTDLHQIPALNELTRAALRLLMNGDSSEWDRALQMPHYAAASMPAMSVHTGAHFIQWMRAGKFALYDYGTPALNRKKYGGLSKPPNIADHYHLLRDVQIDLVAGAYDGIINKADVVEHYNTMRDAGLEVTFKEMPLGHLDMCYAVKEEVLQYVVGRLFSN